MLVLACTTRRKKKRLFFSRDEKKKRRRRRRELLHFSVVSPRALEIRAHRKRACKREKTLTRAQKRDMDERDLLLWDVRYIRTQKPYIDDYYFWPS